MEPQTTERLHYQRCRNRIIDAVELLAAGNEGVRSEGAVEYFESFYDFIPHRDDGPPYANPTVTKDEWTALQRLSAIIDMACDATPRHQSVDAFIASGWATRIQEIAEGVLQIMLVRGRFSEDVVENEPTQYKGASSTSH